MLTDFAAYLANAESAVATDELWAISGLLERVKQNQATPKTDCANRRNLRYECLDFLPLSDEDLVLNAEGIFLELDERESQDE